MSHHFTECNCNKNWLQLREGMVLLDGVLISNNGYEFPVHRALFAATSDFFRAGFSPPLGSNRLNLNCSTKILKHIIDFIYDANLSEINDIDTIKEIFIVADMYCICHLHDFCSLMLINRLDVSNCVDLESHGLRYNSYVLEDAAFHFILQQFENVIEKNSHLFNLSAGRLHKYLAHDLLNIRSEDIIQKVVEKWISVKPLERMEMETELLSTRRLPLEEYGIHDIWPRAPYQAIVILGGFTNDRIGGTMETFDPRSNSWLSWGDSLTTRRAYHGLVELDGFIYLVGGFDGIKFLATVVKLDVNFLIWSKASHMQTSRCYVAVVTLGGYIYALGGHSGSEMRLRSCERYDPELNQWDWISPMNFIRSDAAACVLNSKIYVAGGYDGIRVGDTVEVYDPSTDIWNIIINMPSPRSGLQILPIKQRIFILGGFDGAHRLSSVMSLDPDIDSIWREELDMNWRRSNFSAVYFDGHIWALGGFHDEFGTLSGTEKLGPNGWISGPELNDSRSCPTAVTLNNILNPTIYSLKSNVLEIED